MREELFICHSFIQYAVSNSKERPHHQQGLEYEITGFNLAKKKINNAIQKAIAQGTSLYKSLNSIGQATNPSQTGFHRVSPLPWSKCTYYQLETADLYSLPQYNTLFGFQSLLHCSIYSGKASMPIHGSGIPVH